MTISVEQIGRRYIAFVTEVFMTADGLAAPEVDAELMRLGNSAELPGARKKHRGKVDTLLDEILRCTPQQRAAKIQGTDPTTRALLLDRVLAGTDVLISAAERGIRLPDERALEPTEFFRMLLLQKFGNP